MNTKLCTLLFITAFIVSAGIAPAYAQEPERPTWTTFSIPESGTRVDYPTNVFSISEGKSEDGIGERFRTSDGRALFAIYSKTNDAGANPRKYLKENLRRPRSALQYERVASSFFAISEETEDTVYYSRCNFSTKNRTIHCLDLVYPFHERRAWDPIVTRMSRSLRPLRR
jgi:hypothetical protein